MEGGTHVYLWLIYVDVWQKPSQYCNHPPVKTNKLIKKKNSFVLCPAPCQRRGVRVGWEAELFPTHTPEIVVLWPMSSGLITARQGSALFSDDQL